MEEPGERELKIWLGRKGMGYKWHSLPLRQKGRKDTHIYILVGEVTGSQGRSCLKSLIVLLSRQVNGMVISYHIRE